MSSLVPCACWVPKGAAKEVPDKVGCKVSRHVEPWSLATVAVIVVSISMLQLTLYHLYKTAKKQQKPCTKVY